MRPAKDVQLGYGTRATAEKFPRVHPLGRPVVNSDPNTDSNRVPYVCFKHQLECNAPSEGKKPMDTSTLLVVFLLVIAATLASYALSHWSSVRSALGFGWAATSIGTTMLLTAAAIVVLTFVFRGPLWRPTLGTEQQLSHRDTGSQQRSARPLTASVLPTGAASLSGATANETARRVGSLYEEGGSPTSTGNKQEELRAATMPSRTGLPPSPLRAFDEGDPWAATRCVHIHHPGSDVTQWRIENDCDVPVGIVVSICAKGAQECVPGRQMIVPAKPQRPVTLEEQTVVGYSIRHVACFVATPKAMSLIGAPSEERSTAEWREQFELVRVSDGCLSRV